MHGKCTTYWDCLGKFLTGFTRYCDRDHKRIEIEISKKLTALKWRNKKPDMVYRAVCLIGSTNGDFIDFQGRLTNADWHALAIFAAYTNTKI